MPKSTVTSKSQTTVPKEVRERLGVAPGVILQWDVEGTTATVRVAQAWFLRRRGMLRVGRGSAVADVRRARAERGVRRS